MKDNIFPFNSDRTIDQTLCAVASEFIDNKNKERAKKLIVVGALDEDTGTMAIVTKDKHTSNILKALAEQLNESWATAHPEGV